VGGGGGEYKHGKLYSLCVFNSCPTSFSTQGNTITYFLNEKGRHGYLISKTNKQNVFLALFAMLLAFQRTKIIVQYLKLSLV
jgi:hypothetical protein